VVTAVAVISVVIGVRARAIPEQEANTVPRETAAHYAQVVRSELERHSMKRGLWLVRLKPRSIAIP